MKSKFYFILFIIFILLFEVSFSQEKISDFPVLKGYYFSQKPPGRTPELFAPELFDVEHGYHSPIVLSPDLTGTVCSPMDFDPSFMYSKKINGTWVSPQGIDFGLTMGAGDPTLSPDGKRIYFFTFQPPKPGTEERERIWFDERTRDRWSKQQVVDEVIQAHPTHWTLMSVSIV